MEASVTTQRPFGKFVASGVHLHEKVDQLLSMFAYLFAAAYEMPKTYFTKA